MMTFRGAFGFLSNFHPSPVELDGIRYENAEAAFQARKCADPTDRTAFAGLPAVKARQLGRRIPLRKDWDEVRLAAMEEVVRAKFAQNPDLAARLLATGSMPLVEGNTHGDTFWGVDARTGKGENHLGKILMQIRAELADSAKWDPTR
jgi:ribA/ribD-fused uncharacterized protein